MRECEVAPRYMLDYLSAVTASEKGEMHNALNSSERNMNGVINMQVKLQSLQSNLDQYLLGDHYGAAASPRGRSLSPWSLKTDRPMNTWIRLMCGGRTIRKPANLISMENNARPKIPLDKPFTTCCFAHPVTGRAGASIMADLRPIPSGAHTSGQCCWSIKVAGRRSISLLSQRLYQLSFISDNTLSYYSKIIAS